MGVGVDHGLRLEKKGRGVITAVYDPDHSKVAPATVRAELGNKIMVHDSFEAMALDDNVDVLIIGSPNYIHAGQVEFCAPLRKPVFLEKTDRSQSCRSGQNSQSGKLQQLLMPGGTCLSLFPLFH